MAKSSDFSNGAFHIARSIFESEIWFMPANYLKVWIWLIGKAVFGKNEQKYKGKLLKPGQALITLNETIEMLKFKIGFRFEKPSKKHVWGIYEWLRERKMIVTTKVTEGIIVTICNYGLYQDLSNYEGNMKVTAREHEGEREGNNKRKETKETEETKEINTLYVAFFENDFWPNYPFRNGKRLGKGETLEAIVRHVKIDELELLKIALDNYRNSSEVKRGFAKDPKRFIKNQNWNWRDWLEKDKPKSNEILI